MPEAREVSASPRTTQNAALGDGVTAPLTVAYVLKMFPRFSETFIANEILALERRGVRTVIFSMKRPNEALQQSQVARIRGQQFVIPALDLKHSVLHTGLHLLAFIRAPLRYLRTLVFVAQRRSRAAWQKFLVAPFIVQRARQAGVEHLHAHFASGPARQAKLAGMLSGLPFSFTAHAKDLYWNGHRHGKNNKLKKRLRLAAHVVTISEYNRHFIEHLPFKVPRRRIVTVYNGLPLRDWPWLRTDGRPASRHSGPAPLLLAVGRLVEKKGFAVLIDACSRLRAAGIDFHCLIAGEGPERARLEQRIRERDLDQVVSLPGSIPQDRLRKEFYPRATLLLQPSIVGADGDQDGIPTVILEALACGLPVVATPVSGIGEAVIDRVTGLLVPPKDAAGLAHAAMRVMRDDALAAEIARAGRRLAERRFDLDQNVKILAHLYAAAARGIPRWSLAKLRTRAGLDLPPTTWDLAAPVRSNAERRERVLIAETH